MDEAHAGQHAGGADALKAQVAALEQARTEAEELRGSAEERAAASDRALAALREEMAALRDAVRLEAQQARVDNARQARPACPSQYEFKLSHARV